ncbi:LysE family translocator [Desulfobaculum senezii]|jgi:threonine/homoserine/homoserine lactone efflux protein
MILDAYGMQHWATFFVAALLLNISPGPDMGFILANTVRGGKRHGFAAMFGVWTGSLCHTLFAAAGLSALLVASATAFSMVKYAGAAYLVWLGIQALRSKGAFAAQTGGGVVASPGRIYRQGVFINILNPKAAVFFLAFLPQFVVPGVAPVPMQLALHGVLIILVAALVEPMVIFAGDRITTSLRSNRRVSQWFDRTLGAFFLFLGVRLAVSR